MGDQHGFFQNIKSVQLEETKKVESQCVRDEEGRLLRDKGRIRERWLRFFRSLLNSKSDMLDADIPKRLPQHPVASALGIEPTEEEIATAMRAMENAKAVGPDGLPAELLKLGLQQDRTILRELHRLTILIWRQGKVPQSSGKMQSLQYSTRRATRRSAETTAASRSCHTRVRFSLKWLSGDSALTVRRRDCYWRSSAGFDRIARPRTDVCGSQAAGSWAEGRSVCPYVFHRSSESLRYRRPHPPVAGTHSHRSTTPDDTSHSSDNSTMG